MTISHRIWVAILAFAVAAAIVFGGAAIGYHTAKADDAGTITGLSPEPDAPGSASTPAPAAAPADKLHDPVAAPAAAWDDLKAAKKVGWAVLVFAVLVMLARLAARLGGRFARLGTGKIAVVIGAVGALGASCYNAAAEGGAWTAMLVAGMTAVGHYLDAGKA